MPSFDVVSEIDQHEIDNAINQASKEVGQRYDFRGSETSIERKPEGILIQSDTEYRVNAAYEVLQSKVARRGVPLLALAAGATQASGGSKYRKQIELQEGISKEKAKKVVKVIKDSKLKVQASIQGDTVRVTGKKRDILQEVIAMLRKQEESLELPLQYKNFRD